MPEIDRDNIKRILILGSIGIGNLLLFSPALKIIRKDFPNAKIVMVVLKKVFSYLYESEPDVDEIHVLDVNEVKTFGEKIKSILKVRQFKPDLTITTFPANRFEYNLLPFITGAKYRVAHKYRQKNIFNLSFLQNRRIQVDKKLHDLEQNLNLVIPLGLEPGSIEKKIYINVPSGDDKFAENYMGEKGLSGEKLIGIHPGSSTERGMDYKRWPAEYFAKLCDILYTEYRFKTLIFGGNDELDLKNEIFDQMENKPVIVDQLSLKQTAALISRCSKFVTNDSGLMHIAVAVDVPTIALFGPSDPGRTAPYGEKHKILRLGMECSPCWSIKNLGVGNVNCIYNDNLCLKNLTVELVLKNITG
jgi:heptosyltransferase-2